VVPLSLERANDCGNLLTIVVLVEAMIFITIVGSSGRSGLAIATSPWELAGLGVLSIRTGWITASYAGRRRRT
jgi:hypothetical protein